jgi:hypothetical protein
MNNIQGFDQRNNDAGTVGILAGIVAGAGTFLLGIREWWGWGWGPGNWSRADIFHAYWLAFFGYLFPSYKSDLGTWFSLEAWLRSRHQYDAFVASFWIPFIVSGIVGFVVGLLVSQAINRQGKNYRRGSRIV